MTPWTGTTRARPAPTHGDDAGRCLSACPSRGERSVDRNRCRRGQEGVVGNVHGAGMPQPRRTESLPCEPVESRPTPSCHAPTRRDSDACFADSASVDGGALGVRRVRLVPVAVAVVEGHLLGRPGVLDHVTDLRVVVEPPAFEVLIPVQPWRRSRAPGRPPTTVRRGTRPSRSGAWRTRRS